MDKDYTWVRLYRRITEHELFDDESAFRVFMWILCRVDYKTGTMKFGRFWAAERLGYPSGTMRDLIYRLRDKYKLIDTKSDNRKTTIRVLHWAKYQAPSEKPTPNPTTNRQQTDTTQEYKELKNNINEFTGNRPDRSVPCPLNGSSPLKEKYPNGHTECVEYIQSIEDTRTTKFINRPKQFITLHRILRAGHGFEAMDKTIKVVERKYGRDAWDLATLANWLEKGGV